VSSKVSRLLSDLMKTAATLWGVVSNGGQDLHLGKIIRFLLATNCQSRTCVTGNEKKISVRQCKWIMKIKSQYMENWEYLMS